MIPGVHLFAPTSNRNTNLLQPRVIEPTTASQSREPCSSRAEPAMLRLLVQARRPPLLLVLQHLDIDVLRLDTVPSPSPSISVGPSPATLLSVRDLLLAALLHTAGATSQRYGSLPCCRESLSLVSMTMTPTQRFALTSSASTPCPYAVGDDLASPSFPCTMTPSWSL